jgi:predicted short-subunit dehydrogenase-like oxidoreductase (DUF2520 family)
LLRQSGYQIGEIISRPEPASRRRAGALARAVGAAATTVTAAKFDCDILWLAVPDAVIAEVVTELSAALSSRAGTSKSGRAMRMPIVLHPSGAHTSQALSPLKKLGASTASAHPMMTFVAGSEPSLKGAWFALEGDEAAQRAARQMAKRLGASSFPIDAAAKPLYHAFGAMLSPMLASELAAAEAVGRRAGIASREIRRIMEPIVFRTVANVLRNGPAKSFSGPLARGDVATVASHLQALGDTAEAAVYRALSGYALTALPVKRADEISRLLQKRGRKS